MRAHFPEQRMEIEPRVSGVSRGKRGKMEYQAFRPAYFFCCTRVTLISKPIHFISMEEVKKLVFRKTLIHINKGNPLFARESKGNPPMGLNFQHSSLTLTLTLTRVFFPLAP